MSKIELIDKYINECVETTDNKGARELCIRIIGTFSPEIQSIKANLQMYSFIGMNGGTVDIIKDLNLLKEKLENYKIDLLEQDKKQEQELEKLRLQAEISKNSIHVTATGGNASSNSTSNATSTVSITIDQTIKAINEIPPEVLSADEKEELEEKLSALEIAKNTGNKEKISGKLGRVLKYIADKGIEVGIAALPYLGEISKFIQSM